MSPSADSGLRPAIPQIAEDFDTSETTLAWVVTLPLLLSAVATPVLGKMGDLYGHRRVFLTGFALATVATALTATAWDPATLIFWRTLTQVIGAATMPTSMALINSNYPAERRAKATADQLVADGVAQNTLDVSWKGKSEPAVQTGDGVKEPLNRRATIDVQF